MVIYEFAAGEDAAAGWKFKITCNVVHINMLIYNESGDRSLKGGKNYSKQTANRDVHYAQGIWSQFDHPRDDGRVIHAV